LFDVEPIKYGFSLWLIYSLFLHDAVLVGRADHVEAID